jgi:hypothetical protein
MLQACGRIILFTGKRLIQVQLIQIQLGSTLITFYNAPEYLVSAFRAIITGLLVLNPFFSTHLAPVGNGPQDNLFAHIHGKIFNELAGEFKALVTADVAFGCGAVPDLALPAMHEPFIRQAALAFNIFCRKIFTAGQSALARDIALIEIDQFLF